MQVIYDLLVRSSGHLELREDPQNGIIVAGLRSIKVQFIELSHNIYCMFNATFVWHVTEIGGVDLKFSQSHKSQVSENQHMSVNNCFAPDWEEFI